MNYIRDGWDSYRKAVIPKEASEIQVTECENAFFAGSLMLLRSIMLGLDPEHKVTKADMQRMNDIQKELDDFGDLLELRLFEGPMQ